MFKKILVMALLAVPLSVSSSHAQDLGSIVDVAQAATADGAASQIRIDNLDDETDQLTRDYRAALKQLAALREYNAQLEKLIDGQKKEMVSIRQHKVTIVKQCSKMRDYVVVLEAYIVMVYQVSIRGFKC